MSNDSDADGDTLGIISFTNGLHGTVTNNSDGTLNYTPNDPNYNGTDAFTYTISDGNGGEATATVNITYTPVNDLPAATDDSYATDEDTYLTIAAPGILSNDTDADGDILTSSYDELINTPPAHGSVTVNADGSFEYEPDTDYNGTDSFTYTVSDGNGGEDEATVNITVNPVNDVPTAGNDGASTTPGSPVTFGYFGNDRNPDGGGSLSFDAASLYGGTVIENGNRTFTYTPPAGFTGTDSFTYTIIDRDGDSVTATVTITVAAAVTEPDAVDDSYSTDEDTTLVIATPGVLANDTYGNGTNTISLTTDVTHGTLTLNSDGSFTYVPDEHYNGTDTFRYTVEDEDGDKDTATVTITVNAVEDKPDAQDDNFTTYAETPVNIPALGNDYDPEGDTLTLTIAVYPSHGTAVVNGDGTITYTPDAGFSGTDRIEYTISDGKGGTDTAVIYLTINAVENPRTGDDNGWAQRTWKSILEFFAGIF